MVQDNIYRFILCAVALIVLFTLTWQSMFQLTLWLLIFLYILPAVMSVLTIYHTQSKERRHESLQYVSTVKK